MSSVDAPHVRVSRVVVGAVAVRVAGTVGGVVSASVVALAEVEGGVLPFVEIVKRLP
jgi:hypothetical protein